jgi:hypothetical protein
VISARPAQDSYGSPQAGAQNPFLNPGQSQYGNNPQQNNDLSGNFVPNQPQRTPAADSYGSPIAPGSEAGINPRIVGNSNLLAQEEAGPRDVYGSPVAPVGTSAPVPQDIITAARQPDSYGGPGSGEEPEGEVTGLKVEGEDNDEPLFDNLRDTAFTSASLADGTSPRPDPPASSTRGTLKVDLSSSGEVDLTNGLDQNVDSSPNVDLTGNDDNYDDGATTTVVPLFPGYEDSDDYDQDNYQYDDSDVKNPGLPGYIAGRGDQQGTYGNRPDLQGTYVSRPAAQQQQQPQAQAQPQRQPQQQTYNRKPADESLVVVKEVESVKETEEEVKEEEKIEEEVKVAQVEKEIADVSDVSDKEEDEVEEDEEYGEIDPDQRKEEPQEEYEKGKGKEKEKEKEVVKVEEAEKEEEKEKEVVKVEEVVDDEAVNEDKDVKEDSENYDERLPQSNDEDLVNIFASL